MLTLCAWCEKEGRRTVLHEGQDDQVSHGICEQHQEEMLAQIAQLHASQASNPRRKRQRRR
mgnify:CR=1 FL=1